MNCKELIYLLGDYFDGSMEAQLRTELDSHVAKCVPCVNFLRTYGKTRELCRQLKPEEIPEDLKVRLKAFVVAKAREHRRDIEKYVARAAEEQRRQVAAILLADVEDRLSPTLAAIFEAHRGRCTVCGSFLQRVKTVPGGAHAEPPSEIESHIADFLDALPPGENPVLPA